MERVTSGVAAEYHDHDLDLELPRRIFEVIWVAGRGLGFRDAFRAHAELMDPGLVRLGALAEKITLTDFFEVDQARRAFTATMFGLLGQFDLLLMPTMPVVAFQAEAEAPEAGDLLAPLPWVTWTPYTYPFNLTGQPAISLPCGVTAEGLPVGLQVVGPWGEDKLVLDFAEQIEQTIGFARSHCAPYSLRLPDRSAETRQSKTAAPQTHQSSSFRR
jgi:aspartyl-tRNA(Asn)/glutamyl-tRNA(Gln) amidotransferase subunit A